MSRGYWLALAIVVAILCGAIAGSFRVEGAEAACPDLTNVPAPTVPTAWYAEINPEEGRALQEKFGMTEGEPSIVLTFAAGIVTTIYVFNDDGGAVACGSMLLSALNELRATMGLPALYGLRRAEPPI